MQLSVGGLLRLEKKRKDSLFQTTCYRDSALELDYRSLCYKSRLCVISHGKQRQFQDTVRIRKASVRSFFLLRWAPPVWARGPSVPDASVKMG